MIEIKFSVLPFIKGTSGRVTLRVRWSSNAVKRQEVDFISGVYAEKDRWDSNSHKAKKSTTHHVRNMTGKYVLFESSSNHTIILYECYCCHFDSACHSLCHCHPIRLPKQQIQ